MDPLISYLLIAALKELPFVGLATALFIYSIKKKNFEHVGIKAAIKATKNKEWQKFFEKKDLAVAGGSVGFYLLMCLVTWNTPDTSKATFTIAFLLLVTIFGVFNVSDFLLMVATTMLGGFACSGKFFTGTINIGIVGGAVGIASFIYLPKYLKAAWKARKTGNKVFYSISPYLPVGLIISSGYYFLTQF